MRKHVGGNLTWTQNSLNILSLTTATLRFNQQSMIQTTPHPGLTVAMNWAEVFSWQFSCWNYLSCLFESVAATQSCRLLCWCHLLTPGQQSAAALNHTALHCHPHPFICCPGCPRAHPPSYLCVSGCAAQAGWAFWTSFRSDGSCWWSRCGRCFSCSFWN